MSLDQIRTDLLNDHVDLRAKIRAMVRAAERSEVSQGAREELYASLGHLLSTFETHNAREEALLRDVIASIDAWGPVRAEIMLEEHQREHRILVDALVDASTTKDAKSAVRAVRLLAERLRRHIAREERIYLAEDVLRDELGPPDSFGG